MVEVHCRRRKAGAAVRARAVPQAVEETGLPPPPSALAVQASRGTEGTDRPRGVLALRSNAMTVRADDVALRDLLEDRARRTQHRASGCQPEPLGRLNA